MSLRQFFFPGLLVYMLFGSCNFLQEMGHHEQTAVAFVRNVMAHEYETAVAMLDEEFVRYAGGSDTLQILFSEMEQYLRTKLGALQDARTARWAKRVIYRTDADGHREAVQLEDYLLEMEGRDSLAWARFTFNDAGKILGVNVEAVSVPVPGPAQLLPWYVLVGLGIVLLAAMVWTIVRIVRSPLSRKWLWILAVVVGNFTQFGYNVLNGWFFQPAMVINILPFGFTLGSCLGMSAWLSFPLGMLAAWAKLWQRRREDATASPELQANEPDTQG